MQQRQQEVEQLQAADQHHLAEWYVSQSCNLFSAVHLASCSAGGTTCMLARLLVLARVLHRAWASMPLAHLNQPYLQQTSHQLLWALTQSLQGPHPHPDENIS